MRPIFGPHGVQRANLFVSLACGQGLRRVAKRGGVKAIEKEGRLQDLVDSLRKLALEDPKLAEVLHTFRLRF